MSEFTLDEKPTSNEVRLSDDEVSSAQAEEQAAMNNAQLAHLNRRVVILRATVNRLARENDQLRAELQSYSDDNKEDGQ